MKVNWYLGLLCAIPVLLFAKYALLGTIVPIDDHNQSQFIRTYNPMPLVKPMLKGCQRARSVLSAASSSAGSISLRAVRNMQFQRKVEPEVCENADSSAILTALHSDVESALQSSGCQITSAEGIPIRYRCGDRTFGSVTLTRPERPAGDADGPLYLKIEISEEWAVRDPKQPS